MKGGKEEVNNTKNSRKRKRGSKTTNKEEKKKKKKQPSTTSVPQTHSSSSNVGKSSKPLSFLDKMRARLSGGHFRMINEKLYTCTGEEALNYFKEDPSLFNMYHVGYQEQMTHWPEQPVNIIIQWLKDHSPSLVVADFGCGDARLSRSVKNKVFSFDLVAHNSSVVACDMANNLVSTTSVEHPLSKVSLIRLKHLVGHKTPLDTSSIDVAVFCLSLMGTNFSSYLREAQRVLKPGGWLLIAEVKSRFDPTNGGADPNNFSKAICELGFYSVSKDFSNKMFILFYYKKKEKLKSKKEIVWPSLKPCLYKRR